MIEATPGPWRLSGDQILARSPYGGEFLIATVDPDGLTTIEEERANGRVLAASRQMLVVLQWVLAHWMRPEVRVEGLAEEVAAIIAKAIGGSK